MNARIAAAAAALGLACGLPVTAQEMTWVGGTGTWNLATNWDPQNVPDSGGESALVPTGGGALTITLDLNPALSRVRFLNPSATLVMDARSMTVHDALGFENAGTVRVAGWSAINGLFDNDASGLLALASGSTLVYYGAQLLNDGRIVVNESGTGNAAFRLENYVTFTGTGTLELNGDDNGDRIHSPSGYTFTQDADHTLRGAGEIHAGFTNHGTVFADRAAAPLVLDAVDKWNDGTMRAVDGAELQLNAMSVNNAGGVIVADGGVVRLVNARVRGGTLDRTGSSTIEVVGTGSFENTELAPTGWIDILSGSGAYLGGSSFANEGVVRLNNAGTGDSWIDVRNYVTLEGSGEIWMTGDDNNDRIYSPEGYTLTQAQAHTVRGSGSINVFFTNHGTVVADNPTTPLRIAGAQKANDGLLRATAGATLLIEGASMNGAGGTILADGGTVVLTGSTGITGGTFDRTGTSVVQVLGAATIADAEVAPTGWIDIAPGGHLYWNGSTLANAGTIRLNDTGTGDALLNVVNYVTVSGPGEIRMNGDDFGDRLYTTTGHALTQAADHAIRGSGSIDCPLTTHGLVAADNPATPLRLWSYGKSNDGLLQATDGAQLRIDATEIQNAGGTILADGGTVVLTGNSRVIGGTFDGTGASVIRSEGIARIRDAAITGSGWIDIPSGSALSFEGAGLANEGTIRLNPEGDGDAQLRVEDYVLFSGSGEILMNGDDVGDRIYSPSGYTMTQGSEHTIRGSGAIDIALTSHGTVTADNPAAPLVVKSLNKTNGGLMRAVDGAQLVVSGMTVYNSGTVRAEGGAVLVQDNASVRGGTLDASGGASIRILGNGRFADVAILENGRVEIPTGGHLWIDGVGFVNDGVVTVSPDSAGDASIDLNAYAVFSGSGEVVLQGASAGDKIFSSAGYSFTNGPDHTIRGSGHIVCPMGNQGTVRADRGSYPLRVEATASNAGAFEAWDGAELQVPNMGGHVSSRTLWGGAWRARNDGILRLYNATIDSIAAEIVLDGAGSSVYRDGGTADALAGFCRVRPEGSLEIQGGKALACAADLSTSGRLVVGAASLLSVPGEIRQRTGEVGINGTAACGAPAVQDHGRIWGSGTIIGGLRSEARVEPGDPLGTLTVDGGWTQGEWSRLQIELGGRDPGEFDRLAVTGAATLGGILEIALADGFEVDEGDAFTILTCGSRTGQFRLVHNACPTPEICFEVIYEPTQVRLVAHRVAPSSVEEEEGDGEASGGETEGQAEGDTGDAEGGDGSGVADPSVPALPDRLAFSVRSQLQAPVEFVLDLPEAAHVRLAVFDITGRVVADQADGAFGAGTRSWRWDGRDGSGRSVCSGIYFARLEVQGSSVRHQETVRVPIVR